MADKKDVRPKPDFWSLPMPVPNAAEVAEFARLYERKFGVRLDELEAYDAATRLVQYVWLTRYLAPAMDRMAPEAKAHGQSDPAKGEEG